MNHYAGTITYTWDIKIDKIQWKILEIEGENTTLFVFGKSKQETSQKLLEDFQQAGEIIAYDLSLSTEDRITQLNTDLEEAELYECACFEWPAVDIKDIIERFDDTYEAMVVREAEISKKFWNRIVKVDFVY